MIEPLEYIVMILLPGYQYLPQINPDEWVDNLLGAFVSDFFIVPSVALVIAVFRLRLVWSVIFAIGFMGIEWLFLSLGIYKHFWWQTIYTGIGIFIYFCIGKKIWAYTQNIERKNFIIIIYFFLLYLMLNGRSTFFLVHLLHIVKFHIGWFNNPTRDHMAFAGLFNEMTALLLTISFMLKRYYRWVGIFLLVLLDCVLYKWNILQTASIWYLIVVILGQFGIIFFTYWMVQFLQKKSRLASDK
ncbi:hypothetical protein [Brevibacillus sp. SYSU BS000544]|uniref:hypothetical protein n=1 Tax=Brevibacillus sp. SYSU BS000544 TaxID=3416443 RepID=UPI003CE4834B